MDNVSNKNNISKEILKNLLIQAKNINFTQNEVNNNCSFLKPLPVNIKEEHEDMPQTASIEIGATSTSMIKTEPEWDNFEEEKPECIIILHLERKVIKQNEQCNTLDGVADSSFKETDSETEVQIKTEVSETISEVKTKPDIAFVECKIEHKKVDFIEGELQNEISTASDGANQEEQNEFNEKKYQCNLCSYKTKRRYDFNKHLLRHKNLGVDTFQCSHCAYKTIEKGVLTRHLLRHKDPKELTTFRCDKCDFRTIRRDSLKLHLFRRTLFKCDLCDFHTCKKGILKKHFERHQRLVDTFKCDHCDYETTSKDYLRKHQLRHKDPREVIRFACGYCDFKTVLRGSLKRHLWLRHKGNP